MNSREQIKKEIFQDLDYLSKKYSDSFRLDVLEEEDFWLVGKVFWKAERLYLLDKRKV